MGELSVELCGLKLKNPVIPASGTFGFGYEFADIYDINILGSISIKGTTKDPRFGNPTPRIAECPSGMLNAVGLQNPGVENVISNELPKLAKVYSDPIIANVGGFSKDEYVYCCEKLSACDKVGIVEVNISCPNVHANGENFGTSAKGAYEITKAVKDVSSKPVIVKLTPNVTDITEIARACEAAGADGIAMINTLLGMRIDKRTRKPVLANGTGGYSGPSVLPVAIAQVYRVYEAVQIPIVGMGGISSADDVIEMMLAGARAVQIGAANLTNPYACREIILDLPRVMQKYGINNLKEITGGAH